MSKQKSKSSNKTVIDSPTTPILEESFNAFEIKESQDYSQMKNNIITQTTRICEIISDAGKFGSFYEELTNNIVSSMNTMIKTYVKTGRRSILIDIYDALVEQTDWTALKERFKVDATKSGMLKLPKYTPINTNLKRFTIDTYDEDILYDMYSNMEESTVREFAKAQRDATNNLYSLIDDVSSFETSLCAYRTQTLEVMKQNIECLYALHVNYAKACMNKEIKAPESTVINGKVIKFQHGQKPFIIEALKVLLLSE